MCLLLDFDECLYVILFCVCMQFIFRVDFTFFSFPAYKNAQFASPLWRCSALAFLFQLSCLAVKFINTFYSKLFRVSAKLPTATSVVAFELYFFYMKRIENTIPKIVRQFKLKATFVWNQNNRKRKKISVQLGEPWCTRPTEHFHCFCLLHDILCNHVKHTKTKEIKSRAKLIVCFKLNKRGGGVKKSMH